MTCFRMADGQTLRQWCLKNGYHYHMLYRRLDDGMDFSKAIDEVVKMKASGRNLRSHPRLYYQGQAVVDIYTPESYRLIIQRKNRHPDITLEQAIAKGKLFKKVVPTE